MKEEYEILSDFYNKEITITLEEMFTPVYRDSGKTIIRNKSKLITDEQINNLLDLLHNDYHDLGMTISIYGKRSQVLFDWLNTFKEYIQNETLKLAISRKIGGNQLEGVIALFPFGIHLRKIKKNVKEIKQLILVNWLIHEIRHSYQRVYKQIKYEKSHINYINATGKGYHSQWIERDANQFAQRFMNKNKEKINDILNINFDWNCTWGRFNIN